MSELMPCPFCGGSEHRIDESKMWTGMRNAVISASVIHWCEKEDGQPQTVIQVKGKTAGDAVRIWNTRANIDYDEIKPATCIGDPYCCETNEGYGCYCTDKGLVERPRAEQ